MNRCYAAGSSLFTCLAIALLAIGALAVPTQMAFADDGGCAETCAPYTQSPEYYNMCMTNCASTQGGIKSSCPSPTNNPCSINNNNQPGCPGLGCSTATDTCWCVWGGTGNCYCPN
jgi:hypothetical protein